MMMMLISYPITARRNHGAFRKSFRIAVAGLLTIAICGCGSSNGVVPMALGQTGGPATSNPKAAENPYPRRVPAPPLVGGEWVNTAGPLSLADLRGRFVLLDFWT